MDDPHMLNVAVSRAVHSLTVVTSRGVSKKYKSVSEYDSENLMYSVIQEVLSGEVFSAIWCAVHISLVTLVKDCVPLTEEECRCDRNPMAHVDFLLFRQMDKQPVPAI